MSNSELQVQLRHGTHSNQPDTVLQSDTQSEPVIQPANQSWSLLHASRWPRHYSQAITKALSRDLSDYEPELQEEITRPRYLDMIRYVSSERDQNETYELKETTQVFNPEVEAPSDVNENVEFIKDTSQELEELTKELGKLDAAQQEVADVEEERRKSLVDATSVVDPDTDSSTEGFSEKVPTR